MQLKQYCIMVGIAFAQVAMKERDALYIVKNQYDDYELLDIVTTWARDLNDREMWIDLHIEFEVRNRLRLLAGMEWRTEFKD